MAYPGSPLYALAMRQNLPLPGAWTGYSQHSRDCLPLPTRYVPARDVLRFRDEVLSRDAHVQGWLNTRLVESHWNDHRAGRADHAFELWAVWMLERWSRLSNPARTAPVSRPMAAAG